MLPGCRRGSQAACCARADDEPAFYGFENGRVVQNFVCAGWISMSKDRVPFGHEDLMTQKSKVFFSGSECDT